MQTAASARSSTDATLTGLTYIDTLVSTATSEGMSYIIVNGTKITTDMITTLEGLGYVVNTKYPEGNIHYPQYMISW